ncbi:MAG: hypothetical protein DRN05_03270 [Thermoplasmata archaeon]|nr:MAG: hypothetical protein DRN05_03270 [Thermoplasmata archaeon]
MNTNKNMEFWGIKNMRFCPICGSPNIDWVLPQDWSRWKCKECGYIGTLIVEDGKIADEIRKEYLKKHVNKK